MKFLSTAEVRAILKSAGFNARQVTVKSGSSDTYITAMVRDPKVNVAKVKAVIAPYHTWHMDNTDYVTGQSIRVEVSPEVRDTQAAPYVEAAKKALAEKFNPEITGSNNIEGFPGVYLMGDLRDGRIWNSKNDEHSNLIWLMDGPESRDAIQGVSRALAGMVAAGKI
jgi:hypothetical protein